MQRLLCVVELELRDCEENTIRHREVDKNYKTYWEELLKSGSDLEYFKKFLNRGLILLMDFETNICSA